MAKKRIGIIGLEHWYWALGCAYGCALNPSAELAAVCDEREEMARKIARTYGAKRHYRDYRDLLKDPEVDAVVVTTSTDLHDEVAEAASKAGKDILVGKPISRTLRGADRIIASAKKAGVKLMAIAVGIGRGDRVKGLIDAGAIGRPYVVHSKALTIEPLRAPGVDEPGWFADPDRASGGGFIDHGCYAVGTCRYYFGSEVKSVYALMGKYLFRTWDVEDHGIALLHFQNGEIATLESTFTAPYGYHGGMLIIGTEGEIELRDGKLSIWGKKEPYQERQVFDLQPPNPVFDTSYTEVPVPVPPSGPYFKATLDEFVDYLVTGTAPLGTPEDARKSLEACLAAYQSVATGAPVELPLREEVDVPYILRHLK